MAPSTDILLKQLNKMRWQLWILAFSLLLTYALCVAIIVDPTRWEKIFSLYTKQTIIILLTGLVVLSLLFCTYVVITEKRLYKLQDLVIKEQGAFLRDSTFRLSCLEKICETFNRMFASYEPGIFSKTLNEVAKLSCELFKADYASIMLVDESDNKLKTQGLFGISDETIRSAALQFGEAIAGWVVEKTEALRLNHQTDYSKFKGYFQKERYIQSALSAPLLRHNKLFGVLNITRLAPNKDFTDLDLQFLKLAIKDITFPIEHISHIKTLTEKEKKLTEDQNLVQIGKLAAGLAHDFKNIIFVASGYLEIMAGSPEFKNNLETITKITAELNKMQNIIRNLLILGRHHSLKKKEVSINDLIKNLLEPLKNKLDSQGIRVILNLDRNLSTVTADPEQLQIALINLIQNAEEAMEETSRKELTIITTVVQNNQFNITVSDTGKGIENENLPRIFDTFFSTKELGIGAGLGLSITENIINAHQGKITVESVPGQGATFSITLPR